MKKLSPQETLEIEKTVKKAQTALIIIFAIFAITILKITLFK